MPGENQRDVLGIQCRGGTGREQTDCRACRGPLVARRQSSRRTKPRTTEPYAGGTCDKDKAHECDSHCRSARREVHSDSKYDGAHETPQCNGSHGH